MIKSNELATKIQDLINAELKFTTEKGLPAEDMLQRFETALKALSMVSGRMISLSAAGLVAVNQKVPLNLAAAEVTSTFISFVMADSKNELEDLIAIAESEYVKSRAN